MHQWKSRAWMDSQHIYTIKELLPQSNSIWKIESACKRVSPTNIGALCIKLNHRDNAIGQLFVYALVIVRLHNASVHAPQPGWWHMTPKYSRKLALA